MNPDSQKRHLTATDEQFPQFGADPLTETALRLRRWIAEGGCQSPSGAFHAWRDASADHLAFPYPEITGYALTHFASLRNISRAERDAGNRAAQWLLDRLDTGNLAARDGWDADSEYVFDLAMIATGLMTFGQHTGNERLIRGGLDVTRLLQQQMSADDGLSALATHSQSNSQHQGWATEGLAHLAKVVQCLLIANDLGLADGADTARILIDCTLREQRLDGAFRTQMDESFTMLHPHHYAIEGLWIWGVRQRDQVALERARAGIAWSWQRQLENGGFPRRVSHERLHADVPEFVEQSDVTAQAVRMAVALDYPVSGLKNAIRRLLEVSVEHTHGRAVLYQPESSARHLNTWASLFAHQALSIAEAGPSSMKWNTLV